MRHLNLLPRDRRLGLKREVVLVSITRFLRSLAVGLGALTATGIILSIVIFVATFFVSEATSTELTTQVTSYNELRTEIQDKNSLLGNIDSLGKERIVWSTVLGDLLGMIPPGTTIDSVEIDSTLASISFSGVALARSSLVVFEERMRALPWAENVTAPRANLLSPLNPSYTFGLTVDRSGFKSQQSNGK